MNRSRSNGKTPKQKERTQLTVIPEDTLNKLMAPFRIVFKHKLQLAKTALNAILESNLLSGSGFFSFCNLVSLFVVDQLRLLFLCCKSVLFACNSWRLA
ncbi:hypothetical protein RCL_jg19138.t1 [Rhizophagus clarus]|uniref:Uncharacterized protein n=1 Tax=Rhizophagus clarus TaxID=94130 RepID=A0A8H3M1G5_9GLOM|nr:hypothetical protein RCL_jg19138.t1 [Rhizophagus clarus]